MLVNNTQEGLRFWYLTKYLSGVKLLFALICSDELCRRVCYRKSGDLKALLSLLIIAIKKNYV